MSLVFGAASTDRVDIADSPSIQTLGAFTILMWIYPTTLTASRYFIRKGTVGSIGWQFLIPGASSVNLRLVVSCGTTNSNLVTNTAPLSVNKWQCIAAVWRGTGNANDIYYGDLVAPMTVQAYSTNTNGAGTQTSDTGTVIGVGTGAPGSGTTPFQGSIDDVAIFNRALSLAEMIAWQMNPTNIPGCVLWQSLGRGGTGLQFDKSLSGNNGTVGGAVEGLPAPTLSGRRQQQWLANAAAATGKMPMSLFRKAA